MTYYSEMSIEQLQNIVREGEKKISISYEAVKKADLYSQALTNYYDNRINKPIEAMSKGELMAQIMSQSELASKDTHTLKGTYNAYNEARKVLLKKGVKVTVKQVGKLFKAFDDLAKIDSSIKDYKYKVLEDLNEKMKEGKSGDELVQDSQNIVQDAYKKQQQEEDYKPYEELGEDVNI